MSKVIFDGPKEPYKGFTVKATNSTDGDALIEIFKDGQPYHSFLYPAYRVWNIAAHFKDIVDGELEGHDGGYRLANFNGFTTSGRPASTDSARG